MTHPHGDERAGRPKPNWPKRAWYFGLWALANGEFFFLVQWLMMQNFAFDVPVIDTSTGRDVSLSREEYYHEVRGGILCTLIMLNVAGCLLWLVLRHRHAKAKQQ